MTTNNKKGFLKALWLLPLLLLFGINSQVQGQTAPVNETFSNVGDYGGYQLETWNGDQGGTWTATDARTDRTINGKAIMVRDGELTSPSFSGGIGSLTVTTQRQFSGGSGDMTLTVNGAEVGTIPYSEDVQTTTISNINVAGDIVVVIDATNSSSDRVVIDDLIWTGYAAGAPNLSVTPPSVTDFSYTVGQGPSDAQTVEVSGQDLEPDEATITVSASADFEVSLDDATYSSSVTANAVGGELASTTVFVRLSGELTGGTYTGVVTVSGGGADDVTVSLSGEVVAPLSATLPYSEDFDPDLSDVRVVIVSGQNPWEAGASGGRTYAEANGFNTGETEETWLILPGLDLTATSDELMQFDTSYRFGNDDADNFLKLVYSTDYSGVGDPSGSTWTELPFTKPDASETVTPSGNIDLSGISGSEVYLAFQYRYEPGSYRRWRVSDVEIFETNQVATPSFDPAPGSFIDEVTVAISASTPEATIYYTTDGSEPTTDDTEYTGPLTFTETTTLSARAYADSFDPSDVATGEYVVETATGISTIAELREQEGAGTVTFTGTAVLTYQQGFRNHKYIQDETGGILIDDADGIISTEYEVGDELGEITGEISVFGNMVQFVPAADPGAPLSSGNEPEPIEITLAELYDDFNTYQSRLVTVEALSFDDAGAEFENGTEYGITDINTDDAGIFRTTFFGVDYIGTEVPSAPQTITGLPNSRSGGDFLTARNSADIVPFASDDQVVAPVIEPGSGLFTEPVEVTMSVDDDQASIYYTTDGSEPTESSTLYTGAFTVDETTTVQARAFRAGFEPSGVVAATYSFPTEVTLAEARELPEGTAVIVTGLVTTPDFGFGNAEFYIQDDEAGIKVRWPGFGGGNDPETPFAVGQELELTGTIGSRFEELLINPVDFEVLSSDNELPEATPIEDYGTQWTFDSALQGTRVSMLEVSLVDPAAWPVEPIDSGSGVTVQAEDTDGNIYDIRIDRGESFFDNSPVPPETFNLSGVLGRFQENAQLFPFFEEELQEPESDPRIQIIHNAADPALNEVDVYVNGSLLFDEVAFRSATPFFEAPASFTVALTAAGAPLEDAVFEADVELDTNESYYVIAQGVLDPTAFEPNPDGEAIGFGLDVISGALEESANASNFEFDIYHGVTDAPAVDVVARDIALLTADLGYLDVTDTAISVPADGYTLDINLAGTNETVASFDADLSPLADQVGIVLASGFLNADQGETFALLVTLPDGTTQVLEIATSIGDEPGDLPQEFALNQNYPNPFNPTTSIEYALPEATDVTLEVYNLQGQRVAVLVNGQQSAGSYNVSFDARNLASGMYLYRLQAGNFVQVQKMMLLK